MPRRLLPLCMLPALALPALAADKPSETARGDKMRDAYFRREVQRIADASLAEFKTRADWEKQRPELGRKLGLAIGAMLAEQHSRIASADAASWLPAQPDWPLPLALIAERLPEVIDDGELIARANAVIASPFNGSAIFYNPAGIGMLDGLHVDAGLAFPRDEHLGVDLAGRQLLVYVVVVVAGQSDLLEVVLALGAGRRLADLLYRGEQEADQDRDDCDHHQQLDEGEAPPTNAHGSPPVEEPFGDG